MSARKVIKSKPLLKTVSGSPSRSQVIGQCLSTILSSDVAIILVATECSGSSC